MLDIPYKSYFSAIRTVFYTYSELPTEIYSLFDVLNITYFIFIPK